MSIDQSRPFRGCAEFYADHRYRITPVFARLVAARLGLSAEHRLMDLGTGPGVLAERFSPYVGEVVAVDPEPDMLAEGTRRCAAAGITNVTFVRASSDDLGPVDDGRRFRAVVIGQAFHWMRPQERALANLDPLVDGDGAIALIKPDPISPAPAWHAEVDELVEWFCAGVPNGDHPGGRHNPFDDILRRSPFPRYEELRYEYDLIERPNLLAYLRMRYSVSWVLARVGDRRAELEAAALDRFGWVDEQPERTVRMRDTAVIGLRG